MSFLDVLLRGYKLIYNGSGVQMPQENGLQFVGAGVTSVVDSPATNQTIVTISGGSGSSSVQAPSIWTYPMGAVFTYPSGVNSHEKFDTSGGAILAVLDPSPLSGEICGAKDIGRALSTHSLTVQASSSVQIEYPPGTFQAGNVGVIFNGASSGIDVEWQWIGSYGTWFVAD